MSRQTTIKCDKFINNPEEADLSDESDTSDIDSESDNEDYVLIYSKHDSPDESQVDSEAESNNEDIVDHSSNKEHESVSVLGTETMIISGRRVRTPKHLKDYLFAAEREIPRKISVYFLVGKVCWVNFFDTIKGDLHLYQMIMKVNFSLWIYLWTFCLFSQYYWKKEDQIFICITFLFVNQVNFRVTLYILLHWKINKGSGFLATFWYSKVQYFECFWGLCPLHPNQDCALNPMRVPTGQLLFSIILKQGNNFFKDQG